MISLRLQEPKTKLSYPFKKGIKSAWGTAKPKPTPTLNLQKWKERQVGRLPTRRCPTISLFKKWLGLSLAAGLLASYLFLLFGRMTPGPELLDDLGPAALAFGTGQDLDGDGRPERIMAGHEGLQVLAATGALLLDFGAAVAPDITVAQLGGEYPVLFAATSPSEYIAFAYDPAKGLLRAVTWPGGQMRGYGELQPDGALLEAVVSSAGAKHQIATFRLNRLRLERE